MKKRIAVIVSHPIQHFCPQYTSWAKRCDVDLKVFFASNHGLAPYNDKNFGRIVQWGNLNLDFPYEFLPGAEGKAIEQAIDSVDLPNNLSIFSPNVIVVYGYSQKIQRRAIAWAKLKNIPVLMISDAELRRYRSWIKRIGKSIILPRIYKNISIFLSVGDANEAYYRNYGVQDNRIIRCSFPIDVSHYDLVMSKRIELRSRIRSLLGIPEHHKVLLMVGKMMPLKRQGDLIKFSNLIQSTHDDITVLLVGAGPDESILRAQTKRNGVGGVVFAGFVPPDVLAKYYCAADIYVQCSDQEAHSLAISEAIYCGLPVVLSDKCGSYGPSDDVRPGLNGFTYRCGDVGDLSRVLLHALEKNDQSRMSAASRRIGRYHQKLAHGEALEQALSLLELDNH